MQQSLPSAVGGGGRRLRRALRTGASALVLLAGPSAALAASETWTGAASSDWNTAGNWSPAAVPTGADAATINDPGKTVNVGAAGGAASTLDLGTNAGQTGRLTVDGALILTSATVGDGGTGELDVRAGGSMTTTGAVLGKAAGATGTLTVTGAGASLSDSGALTVGQGGHGEATVSAGASATVLGDLTVDGTGTGKLAVSGASLTQGQGPVGANAGTGTFIVGNDAAGTLTVDGGGTLSTRFSELGANAGSNGQATVTGSGSTWTIRAGGDVGFDGTGSLSVLDGGAVAFTGSSGAVFGFDKGASGTGLVSGAGSKLSLDASLTVGDSGTGHLTVNNGGAVSVGSSTTIGSAFLLTPADGGTGTLTVDGAGSTLTSKGFTVGASGGLGSATISNGAVVSGTILAIAAGLTINGVEYDGSGSVTVTGAGSTLKGTSTIDVGENGVGALTVQAGGQVSTADGYIGSYKNKNGSQGTGTVLVAGAGSGWTSSGTIRAGDQGVGALTIQAGAVVSDKTGLVGASSGGKGAVVVDGSGSAWTSSANVTVGSAGTGVLTVSNGGAVSAGGAAGAGTLTIAQNAGASGVLNIGAAQGDAAAAAGTINAAKVVFGAGTGALVFNHTGANYVFTPAISGAGSVTQTAGTTVLAVAETYSGATTIAGGDLVVNGALASPTVAVRSGGTLSGSGSLAGAVSVASGGALGGRQGQTLTLGSLTLADGAALNVALGAPGTTGLFDVTGDLTLDGVLNVSDIGGFGEGLYRIVDYGGDLTGNGLAVGSTGGAKASQLSVQTSIAGQVNLIYAAAPATTFWNGAHTTPNGAINGGSGTWSRAPTNWTNAAGDTSGAWAGGMAIFAAAPGVVTIDDGAGAVEASGLQFAVDGYSVTGQTLTLTGAAPAVRVGDGTAAGAAYVATIAATIAGSGGLAKTDLGTLVLTGANSFTGGVDVVGGALGVSSDANLGDAANRVGLDGGILAATAGFVSPRTVVVGAPGGGVSVASGATLDLSGPVSGAGALAKLGAGTLRLSGASAGFTGQTTVDAGILRVDGSLGGTLSVQSGARLQGVGQVGATTVASGGTIAAGDSIGTLTVAGALTLASGSTTEVELNAAGQADLIHVTGQASLGGTLKALPAAGTYALGQQFTVVTADGGRSGTFSALALGAPLGQPFLTLGLAYDGAHAYVDVVRNAASFCSVAASGNQCQVANGADGLGAGSGLYVAIANLPDAASAQAAFDALSGEVYAENRAVAVAESRFLRQAVLGRLAGEAGAGNSYGAWVQGFGDWGHADAGAGAAAADRRVDGVFLGADAGFAAGSAHGRAGLVAGYSESVLTERARASRISSDTWSLGAYAAIETDQLRFSGGAAYGWRSGSARRSVAFGGFSDALASDPGGHTGQVFGEAAYRFGDARLAFEPYAGIAYVSVRQDGFAERGGASALAGAGSSTNATVGDLGLRAVVRLSRDEDHAVTLRAGLGWRGAWGDIAPVQALAFRAGGPAFAETGAPIARNALAATAEADIRLSARTRLTLTYDGQVASATADHAAKLGVVVAF